MEWPSGFLGRVEAFELRIILRGGSKMYLSAWCHGRSQSGVLLLPEASTSSLDTYVSATHAKVCRMPSPDAVLISNYISGWYLLAIDGPEKSRTDRPVRPTRRIP